MLDKNMLYLMKAYQASMSDGRHLDPTIKFLEHTSQLIGIFRDKRPICSLQDDRIVQMKNILEWFEEWEESVQASKVSKGEKRKSLPSWESMEDLKSLLKAFPKIVEIHLSDFPGMPQHAPTYLLSVIKRSIISWLHANGS